MSKYTHVLLCAPWRISRIAQYHGSFNSLAFLGNPLLHAVIPEEDGTWHLVAESHIFTCEKEAKEALRKRLRRGKAVA